MKNKALTYLLLAIVLVVWGIIFNKIFQASSDESFISVNNSIKIKSDTLSIAKKYQLKLNYTEPFLGTSYNVRKKILHKPKPVKVIDLFPIENLVYLGMIKNAKKKSTIAIVKWRGVEAYLAIGEKIENIKIVKIENSFIEVKVEGLSYKVLK